MKCIKHNTEIEIARMQKYCAKSCFDEATGQYCNSYSEETGDTDGWQKALIGGFLEQCVFDYKMVIESAKENDSHGLKAEKRDNMKWQKSAKAFLECIALDRLVSDWGFDLNVSKIREHLGIRKKSIIPKDELADKRELILAEE